MSQLELEALLKQEGTLRKLARRLIADPDLAEDVVQDVWVTALERPDSMRGVRSPLAWMRTVVRNLSLQKQRSEGRRTSREHTAARREALPSASELVEEMTLRREVADAVLKLEEPCRSTLYLRFFRGLSLKRIAREQGVPLSTVHDRIQRGIERLRTRLDRAHGGDRRSWALTLLPLARPRTGLALTALGGVLMSTTFKVAAATVLVGGAVGIWVLDRGEGVVASPSKTVAAPVAAAELAAPDIPRTLADAGQPEAERVALAPASAEAPSATVPATATVFGRVIDLEGRPIAGVEVSFEAAGATLSDRTNGEGRFQVVVPREPDAHTGEGPSRPEMKSWALHDASLFLLAYGTQSEGDFGYPASLQWGEDSESILVAAPRRSYAGRVVDGDGTPVPHATLTLRVRAELFRRLDMGWWMTIENPGWRSSEPAQEGTSIEGDDEGRFEMPDVTGGEWVFLDVDAPGFTSHGWGQKGHDVPPHDDLDLVLVLASRAQVLKATGTVIDPDGAPVEGAQVSLGHEIVSTDADGSFRVTWDGAMAQMEAEMLASDPDAPTWMGPVRDGVRVTALKEGFLPEVLKVSAEDLAHPLVLRLGAEPASIAGRVVDPDGQPIVGAHIWVRDPTLFGRQMFQQGETASHMMTTAEEALRGGFGRRGAVSGQDGEFDLGGLLERTYDVQVYDGRTATMGEGWELAAGASGVELVLTPEPGTTRVAGRVLSFTGAPIVGLRISPRRGDRLMRDMYRSPPYAAEADSTVKTDEEGRFAFPSLATAGTLLVLNGERVLFETVDLAQYADLEDMQILQPLLCEMQIDLGTNTDVADELQVLDADGEILRIAESRGAFISHGDSASIQNGLSAILRVLESATTVVLLREDEEVDRLSLDLDPDARTIVRP